MADSLTLEGKSSFARLESLFHRLVQIEPDQRSAFLNRECPDDSALAASVREILAGYESPDSLTSLFGQTRRWYAPEPLPEGARLGEYRVEKLLGVGGMGAVYLGHRADGRFERKVAIKCLAAPLLNHLLGSTLYRERTILSRLDHPYIAKLMDLGEAEDGQPFFVMEYVPGLPIDLFCCRHGLNLSQRLALFAKVCEAVDFAHRHLVLHLDLKPGNILVTPDGTPKLLDFGLAQVLRQENDGAREEHAPPLFFTPNYASPEQVYGEPVSVRSDVYALGATLFQLVTGQPPHRRDANDLEVMRRTMQSARLPLASGKLAEAVSKGHRLLPIRPSQLRGDMDQILLKAMASGPLSRYHSAAQMAEDTVCFQARKPILARPWPWPWRIWQGLRRHPFKMLLAATFLISVLVLTAQINRQSKVLQKRLTEVNEKRAVSQASLTFLSQSFETAEPAKPGAALVAGDILESGLARIEGSLADHPITQAALTEVLARVCMNLGDFTTAECLLQQTLVQRETHLPPSHRDLAKTMDLLGRVYWLNGNLDLAEAWTQKALARIEVFQPLPNLENTVVYQSLALVFDLQGRWTEAEDLFLTVLDRYDRLGLKDPFEEATTLNNLAVVANKLGQIEKAIELMTQALDMQRQQLGNDHPMVAKNLNNLGHFHKRNGNFPLAETCYLEVLDIQKRILPANHPHIALAMNNLAALYQAQDRFDLAKQFYLQSLAIQKQAYAADHPFYLKALNNYGSLLYADGDYLEARDIFLEVLQQLRNQINPNPAEVSQTLNNYGMSLKGSGQYGEALAAIRESFDIRIAHLGPDHPSNVAGHYNIAGLYELMGDWEEASAQYQKAYDLQAKHFPPEHPMLGSILVALGRAAMSRGELGQAKGLMSRGLGIFQETLPEGHRKRLLAEITLGDCLMRQGRWAEAGLLLKRAIGPVLALYPPEHRFGREAILLIQTYDTFAPKSPGPPSR